MDGIGDLLFAIALVLVVIFIIMLFLIDNNKLFHNRRSEDEQLKIRYVNPDLAQKQSIFFNYNHNSEKEWFAWIAQQSNEVKRTALQKIKEHLENKPKHWGYLTLEAIDALKVLKDLNVEPVLKNFFDKNIQLWGEYKSVSNYYQKTAEVLAEIYPQSAYTLFKAEFDQKNPSQNSLERKVVIIETLPMLEEKGSSLIVEIVLSSFESFAVRSQALRKYKNFRGESGRSILLEVFRSMINKFRNENRELKTDDSQIVQDLIKESIRNIGQADFFQVLDQASQNQIFHRYIINTIIKLLEDNLTVPSPYELYSLLKLRDNDQAELRKALGKYRTLDFSEINNIITQRIPVTFDIKEIFRLDIKNKLPIPISLKKKFEDFKSLFLKHGHDETYANCDKPLGGVLLTGDNELEKAYFSKALAGDKCSGFAYINIEDIKNKDHCAALNNILETMEKPFLLYIENPDLLFDDGNSLAASHKRKFTQILFKQALDSKVLLVGAVPYKLKEITDQQMLNRISKLRHKFFAQSAEMNTSNEHADRVKVVEEYLRFVGSARIDNKKQFAIDLTDLGTNKPLLEFTFYVIDILCALLVVYAGNATLTEVQDLQAKFASTLKLSPLVNESQATTEEIVTETTGPVIEEAVEEAVSNEA